MAQITIPLDTSAVAKAIDGNKTYLLLLSGAAMIVANHFGLIPPQYVPDAIKGHDWIMQLYMLAFGATGRSALKKLEADVPTVSQALDAVPDKADLVARFGPLIDQIITDAIDKRLPPKSA